jgi:hypothetical protein
MEGAGRPLDPLYGLIPRAQDRSRPKKVTPRKYIRFQGVGLNDLYRREASSLP